MILIRIVCNYEKITQSFDYLRLFCKWKGKQTQEFISVVSLVTMMIYRRMLSEVSFLTSFEYKIDFFLVSREKNTFKCTLER